MCILVALAKLLANALTVQLGFRVIKNGELCKRQKNTCRSPKETLV